MTEPTAPPPTPSVWQYLRRWDWETIGFVVLLKVLLFTFAVQSVSTAGNSYDSWMGIWERWDAVHYLDIAERGYSATGPDRVLLAFFPAYPFLVRGLSFLTRDVIAAALIISGVASIAVGLLMKRLVRVDDSNDVARSAVWFLFIYPTAFFLHIPYTESLFIALVLGSVLAARREQWFLASILGACACFTRLNGLMIAPVLLVEAFLQFRATRRFRLQWLWIAIVPLGFADYLLLNYWVTGDFFAFTQIQQQHWFKKLTPPWIGIRESWLRTLGINPIEGLHEFAFIIISLIGTVLCWVWLRASYAVWMTLNWLLITSTDFILSVPRYTLPMFPIFILLARASVGRPLVFATLTIASLLYFGLYAGRFGRGLWAF